MGGTSAESARSEAPKVLRRVGCGEGMSPSPPGEGSGEGAMLPPQKNFDYLTSKWCILVRI